MALSDRPTVSESIKNQRQKRVTIARRTAILCRALPQEKVLEGLKGYRFSRLPGIHKVPVISLEIRPTRIACFRESRKSDLRMNGIILAEIIGLRGPIERKCSSDRNNRSEWKKWVGWRDANGRSWDQICTRVRVMEAGIGRSGLIHKVVHKNRGQF